MNWLTEPVNPLYGVMSPGFALLLTLLLGFGGVMLIRIFVERDFYLLRWWTFRVGDSIGFSIYAYFTAKALQDYVPSGAWYTQRWFIESFTFILALIGLAAAMYLLKDGMVKREITVQEANVASEKYHTWVTWPCLFALIGTSIVPVWTSEAPVGTKLAAYTGLVIYAITLGIDSSPLVDSSAPGR